ncbi:Na+/H+ antiporter subunit E [Paucisalibacillus globulus]|uniref:Na+/H+ antiporter subunit E n=1 Tax=Paucisalibacillus globulus TaxID=351095 RepID=UPI000BB89FBA|nr:Na+/H+ antiporter subunit E [Paucisalibacillus globulus]
MPFQILVNIFIAFLWMFFQDEWNFLSFLSGYIVGLIILFFMRRFFQKPFYLFFVWAALKLLFVFARELMSSAIVVIGQILRPKNITPGIFKIDTDLEGDVEITLLSLLICLTPGSVVMEVTPDGKSLYVHAMDIPDSKESVLKSQIIFERAIKDVTRKYV